MFVRKLNYTIHLSTQDIQFILGRFATESKCRLLLTSRDTLEETSIKSFFDMLENLPGLTLTSAETEKEIIDLYRSNAESKVSWSQDIKEDILNVSEGNLWLLSYALEGYTGKGSLISWIKEGVAKDLHDLEKHKMYKCNCEILLALSPLYMHEMLTAQTFLVKVLGYNRQDIDKLLGIGEVIKRKINGDIFYGLPHSSLAVAYWDYGDNYRKCLKFSDYDEHILQYIQSKQSNSLTVLVRQVPKIKEIAVRKIFSNNCLVELIRAEHNLSAVASLLRYLDNAIFEKRTKYENWFSEELQQVLADKINSSDDFFAMRMCLDSAIDNACETEFLKLLDQDKIADHILKASTMFGVYGWLRQLTQTSPEASKLYN